jgi:hypothetical protein
VSAELEGSDSASPLDSMLSQAVRASADVVDAAVERMLVTPGEYGVAVYTWIDGNGAYTEARLSTDVEPMTIAYLDGPPPED